MLLLIQFSKGYWRNMDYRRPNLVSQSRLRRLSYRKSSSQNRNSSNREEQNELMPNNRQARPIEPLFDSVTGKISPFYMQTINKINNKPIIHIGICLSPSTFQRQWKLLFNELFNKIANDRSSLKQFTQGVCFTPNLSYSFEGCETIFFLFSHAVLLNKDRSFTSHQQKCMQIFLSFSQFIITDAEIAKSVLFENAFNQIQQNKLRYGETWPEILKFKQRILIYSENKNEPNILKSQQNSTKVFYCNELKESVVNQHLWIILKKNPYRCINNHLKINVYLLICTLKMGIPSNSSFNTELLNESLTLFLEEEVQRKYDRINLNYIKSIFPADEQKIEILLRNEEKQSLVELVDNIRILGISKKRQEEILHEAMTNISAITQQILDQNRQVAQKSNNTLLNNLYDQLMINFQNRKYFRRKDKVILLTEDFEHFMDKFDSSSISCSNQVLEGDKKQNANNMKICNSSLIIFNDFMKKNKEKFYRKVTSVDEDRNLTNRKKDSLDEMVDKVEIKKKMLMTLQKEVRQMEEKKATIEQQNLKLKKISDEINDKLVFDFDFDDERTEKVDQSESKRAMQIEEKPKIRRIQRMQTYETQSPKRSNKSPKKKNQKNDSQNKSKNSNSDKSRKCLRCCKCQIF